MESEKLAKLARVGGLGLEIVSLGGVICGRSLIQKSLRSLSLLIVYCKKS